MGDSDQPPGACATVDTCRGYRLRKDPTMSKLRTLAAALILGALAAAVPAASQAAAPTPKPSAQTAHYTWEG